MKNEMERPRDHLQLSDSEVFGKTQGQGEKNNSNVFVVSEKSSVEKGTSEQADTISASPSELSLGCQHACAGACTHVVPCTGPCVTGSLQGVTGVFPHPVVTTSVLLVGYIVTDT